MERASSLRHSRTISMLVLLQHFYTKVCIPLKQANVCSVSQMHIQIANGQCESIVSPIAVTSNIPICLCVEQTRESGNNTRTLPRN